MSDTIEVTLGEKYFLSTEGYYFVYRRDKYNFECIRADFFRGGDLIKSINVIYPQYGINLGHSDVINMFEAEILLGVIK